MANLAHRRLSGVASHVRGGPSSSSTGASTSDPSGKKKIVVCRDLGDKVMPLLYAREDFEVCRREEIFGYVCTTDCNSIWVRSLRGQRRANAIAPGC